MHEQASRLDESQQATGRRARPTHGRLHTICSLLVVSAWLCLPAATTSGYQNLPRTEEPGTLLSHPIDNDSRNLGRTTTVQYVAGWIFVGAEIPGSSADQDKEFRVYDIEDPTDPIRMFPSDFGHEYDNDSWGRGNFGWNAHGSALIGSFLHPYRGRGVDEFGGTFYNGGPRPTLGGHRAGMAGPWDATLLWYGSEDRIFEIGRRFTDAEGNGNTRRVLAEIDHTSQYGGGDWHPMFFGDLLIYARSGGADTDGVVIYRLEYHDMDDPDTARITPHLVTSLPTGFKAYWPNLCSDGSGLYVMGSHTRIFMLADITAAAVPGGDDDIRTVATFTDHSARNATYPTYQDHYAFMDQYKIDITKMIAGDPNPIALELDEEGTGVDCSQMSRPLGNLWLTGGYGSKGGMGVWLQQQEADTTRPRVMYHIPQANRTNYPRHAPLSFIIPETPRKGGPVAGVDFAVRKILAGDELGEPVAGLPIFDMSGILTFTPYVGLDADATYQVDFFADPDSGAGFQDAAGNYIEPYSFRFATGGGVAGDPPPQIDAFTADDERVTTGTTVTVDMVATTTGSAEYRFNFGDGYGDWGNTASASATFETEGRFRVLGQVRDDSGFSATATLVIAVSDPPTAPQPTRSSSLAVSQADGRRLLWTVNPDADSVAVLDLATGSKLAEHPVGTDPRSIALDDQGRLWVSCHDADRLDLLHWNSDDDAVVTDRVIELDYGSAPFGVCASRNGAWIYVSLSGSDQLARFASSDPADPTIIDSVPTPRPIAVSGDGTTVYVGRFISGEDWGEVGAYTSTDDLFEGDHVIKLVSSRLAIGGDRGQGVPNYLSGLAIHPYGAHLLVTSNQTNTSQGHFYGVDDLEHDSTVRAIVSLVDIGDGERQDDPNRRRDIDNSADPSAIAFSPDGDYAFVTLQGNNRLAAFSSLDLEARSNVTATIVLEESVGLAPQGLLVDQASMRVAVQNFMGRSVTLFDASPMLDGSRTDLVELATTRTVAREPLSPTVLRGKQIFYNAADERMSAEGYISCATCHLDGDSDGRVWDFTGRGEGLRRTTDLRGRAGVGGHGNVHWSANFDEIHDFEHDMRGPFGGLGFIDDTDFASHHPSSSSVKRGLSSELDALAAYVSSLGRSTVPRSPHRQADGALTEAAVAGKAVFTALDCADCHQGEIFTDRRAGAPTGLGLEDIASHGAFSGTRLGGGAGSLDGIDVPTLWGLHATDNYLHHGMARSLEEVFAFTAGVHYEAEELEEIWTASDSVEQQYDEGTDNWPHVVRRNWFAGGVIKLEADKEDLNGNDVIDDGEDVNGNGSLDIHPSGVRLSQVDGGAGGAGLLWIRYIAPRQEHTLTVTVNGSSQTVDLVRETSVPNLIQRSHWDLVGVAIDLRAGTDNRIDILRGDERDIYLDAVWVANESVLTRADAHRRVLAANDEDQANLLAYLRQIDGRDDSGALPADGDSRVSAVQSRVHVRERATEVAITLRRSGSTSGAFSIAWQTAERQLADAATAGADFTAASGTVAWEDGDNADKIITIALQDDTLPEGDERFVVLFAHASGAVVLGEPSFTEVVILDNEVLSPHDQVLLAARSAVDDGADGSGDRLSDAFLSGAQDPASHQALLVVRLDDDPADNSFWGADLQVTLADDSGIAADMPNIDAELLRVDASAELSAGDFEVAALALLADDFITATTVSGERVSLTLSAQQDFLQVLRAAGASVGDHLVIRLSADGPLPGAAAHYLFDGTDAPPAIQLVSLDTVDTVLRTIAVDVIPGSGVEAGIDDGSTSPVPVSFEGLLPTERHRIELIDRVGGDG